MITQFLSGSLFMAFLVAGLYFLKFWRQAKDGLFLLFAMAFIMLGLERLVLAFVSADNETLPYVYLIRLAAFCLIILGIAGKNRR
jgi:hypothetical protein